MTDLVQDDEGQRQHRQEVAIDGQRAGNRVARIAVGAVPAVARRAPDRPQHELHEQVRQPVAGEPGPQALCGPVVLVHEHVEQLGVRRQALDRSIESGTKADASEIVRELVAAAMPKGKAAGR